MPNNAKQPTLPELLNRKRKRDNVNTRHHESSNSGSKRRSVGSSSSNSNRINKNDSIPETVILDTPEKDDIKFRNSRKYDDKIKSLTFSRFRELSVTKVSPLPRMPWVDSNLLWTTLIKQDQENKCLRGDEMFRFNPEVQPRMRSILLDWLIEVSDVYKLHRETYYLAQDYIDRVLLVRKDTPKQELQLLGISCLFLAAKVEEIYPPKVSEFAYVTDGACSESQILDYELLILSALEWKLCPLTPAGWLRLYIQLACHYQKKAKRNAINDVEFPRFQGAALPHVSKLLDLATLDAGCVSYTYSVLAASALALYYGKNLATEISQIQWKDMKDCVKWMAPFAIAISSAETANDETDDSTTNIPKLSLTNKINFDDLPNIQNHTVSLDLLDTAQAESTLATSNLEFNMDSITNPEEENLHTPCGKTSSNPQQIETPEGLLTPPSSNNRGKVLSDVTSITTNTTTANILKPTELFTP